MIAVYVPVFESGIKAGSGIVGSPVEGDPTRVLIDYEGNLYGAVGLDRYANRVARAYDRHVTRYPTVARMTIEKSQLAEVGLYDPSKARVLLAGQAWTRLAEWLGVDELDADELVVQR